MLKSHHSWNGGFLIYESIPLDVFCWFCNNLEEGSVNRLIVELEKALIFLFPDKNKSDLELLAQKFMPKIREYIQKKKLKSVDSDIPILLSIHGESGDYIKLKKNYSKSRFSLLPNLINFLKKTLSFNFEKLCALILIKNDFKKVGLTKRTKDGGLDVFAFLSPDQSTVFKKSLFRNNLIMLFGEAKTKRKTTKRKNIDVSVLRELIGSWEHFKIKPLKFIPQEIDVSKLLMIPIAISNSEFTTDAIDYAEDMNIGLFDIFLVAMCIIDLQIACHKDGNNWQLDEDELNKITKMNISELSEEYSSNK